MDSLKRPVVNYFLVINSPVQFLTMAKLVKDFNLPVADNVLFYRKPFFRKDVHNDYAGILKWQSVHVIPFFETRARLVLWINFIIHLSSFFLVFLRTRRKGNLVIGNYAQHGNRAICNILSKYWLRVFVIDEGLSTVKMVDDRSALKRRETNSRMTWVNKLFRTGHPEMELTFYTHYLVEPNGTDIIFHAEDVLWKPRQAVKVRSGEVLFIGSSLVESGIISREYFDRLIARVKEVNQGREIVYFAHPREEFIFTLKSKFHPGFSIIKLNFSIEKYLSELENVPETIASSTSTAYLYAARMMRSSTRYQTYILANSQILRKKDADEIRLLYPVIHQQLREFDVTKIEV